MRDLDQTRGLAAHRPRHIHPAGIAVPAIHDHRHIDVQNIAIGQNFRAGDAMADHMIDRNARGMLITLVSDRGRHRTAPRNLFADEIVDQGRRDPGPHHGANLIQNLGRHLSGSAHSGKIRVLIDANAISGHTGAHVLQRKSPSFSA